MRTSWVVAVLAASPALAAENIAYQWFEYAGRDAALSAPLPDGHFRNPILAGYYPDPAITRVGERYYLVNSTFAHWPGIPIHESRDLVNWTLIGHALSDPTKISFDGLDISRGVFAPSIHHHDGTWYVINTLVDAGGNFFVTAPTPRGPWSDPVWLKEIDGIDPSMFFDDDGKAYILNNGAPEGPPLYEGHRAIWIQEFDIAAKKVVGPRKVIVNGGVDLAKKPIWIEGPHLYRVGQWYYLMCAEGGTGPGHSEVILRGKSPWGPFEANPTPILTQRDLDPDREHPVSNAGHADLVQMQDGSWWAVFLASRPYQGDRYNTGRETFLLPVSWKSGWPLILEPGKPIPYSLKGPRAMKAGAQRDADLLAGNFTRRDEFDMAEPGPEWLQIYVPTQRWYQLRNGALVIQPLGVGLGDRRNASFYARRQAHQRFAASTEFVPPRAAGTAAGLAAYQNDRHWYFFGARRKGGQLELFLERRRGGETEVVSQARLDAPGSLRLLINGSFGSYSFFYDAGDGWQALKDFDDASFLSTEIAGGFVGTVLGPYARQE